MRSFWGIWKDQTRKKDRGHYTNKNNGRIDEWRREKIKTNWYKEKNKTFRMMQKKSLPSEHNSKL